MGECLNCNLLFPEDDEDESEFDEDLIEEIADIARWEQAGFPTDWSCYGFEHKRLFTTWIDTEKSIAAYQQARIAGLLDYQTKILKAAHGVTDN